MVARRRGRLFVFAAAAVVAAPLLVEACSTAGNVGGASAAGTGGSTKKPASSGATTSSGTTTSAASTSGAGTSTSTGAGGATASSSTSSTGSGGVTGSGGNGGMDAGWDGDAAPPMTLTLHPNAPPLPGESTCTVVETTNIPEPDFNHLPMCTPISYATNPPSGGNHWPIWAAYKIYTQPVPEEMYVHDLEHGAIVLAYRCSGSCPAVVAALTQVFNSEADPLCLQMIGPPARMVLTPDPLLATPIAAAAWGATYTATCIDIPSLQAFANANYGHGREDFCTDGQDIEAMPPCPLDGGDGG